VQVLFVRRHGGVDLAADAERRHLEVGLLGRLGQ
jgi:hypothetical protein